MGPWPKPRFKHTDRTAHALWFLIACTTSIHCVQVQLPFACEFEERTWCGLLPTSEYNPRYTWNWNSGQTPTPGTGPLRAHQGNYYIYTEASDPARTGDKAIIETPTIDFVGDICLTFYYHMYGPNIGSLYVLTEDNGGVKWFEQISNVSDEDQWNFAQVDVNLQSPDKIHFVGVRGNEIRGDIALDTVSIRAGTCTVLPLSCSFEYNFCGLIQVQADDFDWELIGSNGPTETYNTGPNGAYDGISYIYTEASYPRQLNDSAILETFPLNYEGWICLQFYYHMYGVDMGSLRVTKSDRETIIFLHGDHGPVWHRISKNVKVTAGDTIRFTAMRGTFIRSDIAMDMLDMSLGNCTGGSGTTDFVTTVGPTEDYLGNVMSCDFETMVSSISSDCWVRQDNQDDFDWSISSGKTPSGAHFDRRINGIRYPVTGPAEAEQGLKYAYIEASAKSAGLESSLIFGGEMFNTGTQSCLRFSYSMNGFHCGKLYVFLNKGDGKREELWGMEGDKMQGWKDAAVDVNLAGSVAEFGLTATTKGSFSGDISLDDVQIITGPCQLDNDHQYFWFCQFETGPSSTWCGMEQEDESLLSGGAEGFDWTMLEGETPSRYTGPSSANSPPFYIFIEASLPQKKCDYAIIFLPSSLTLTGDVCVEFFYHMYGFHVNALEVIRRQTASGNDVTEFILRGEKGNIWDQARVTIQGLQQNEKIGFRATVGDAYSGDIALDNIGIRPDSCASPTSGDASPTSGDALSMDSGCHSNVIG